jgi:hypothetical protein
MADSVNWSKLRKQAIDLVALDQSSGRAALRQVLVVLTGALIFVGCALAAFLKTHTVNTVPRLLPDPKPATTQIIRKDYKAPGVTLLPEARRVEDVAVPPPAPAQKQETESTTKVSPYGWRLQAPRSRANPDDISKRLDEDRSKLESMKHRANELQSDIEKIAAERECINWRFIETGRLIRQSEAQLNLIESRLGELEAQETLLRQTLGARHRSIAELLAAMQRMGRNPPPVMETRREDALSMVRSAMQLAKAFPELRGQAAAGGRCPQETAKHTFRPGAALI